MANNVGKIPFDAQRLLRSFFVLIFLMQMNVTTAYVELTAKSIEGKQLLKAGVGRPFIIEVSIVGHEAVQDLRIEGSPQLKIESTAKQIAMINGRTTVKYRYQVRIDKPGNYTVGPATVEIAGSKKQSNTISISVSDEQKTDRDEQNDQIAFLRLTCDKSHAVVGEKILGTISFYSKADKVQPEGIHEPVIDGKLGAKRGPLIKDEVVNGENYRVVQYEFELFPSKPGRLVVPAFSADMNVQREARDQLSAFSLFFQFRNESRTIYSNACVIDVDPLPVDQGAVQAVGIFKQLSATLKPAEAKAGEGMVLTVAVEGEGDLQAIETPQLSGMPAALKWYESKRYVRDTTGFYGLPVACFEYIVQGLQQGDWEIPEQQFTYFDVEKRLIGKLVSSPVQVTIRPGIISATAQPPSVNDAASQRQEGSVSSITPLTILTAGNWHATNKDFTIPWVLFFILLFFPLFVLVIPMAQKFSGVYLPLFTYKSAFMRAKGKLKKARADGDTAMLLSLFLELFAVRLHVPVAAITEDFIADTLRQAGMNEEKIRSWDAFIDVLQEESFGKNFKAHSKAALFDQAQVWILELEALI